MEVFSNPWVIGIGGGLVSGLLVTLITRYLFSKRERREYRQKIETANNEIIYAIRPTIAEKVIPSTEMFEALFSATARKYSVSEADLYSRASLANELIKEVMDNTFLSSQQKVEFCDLLSSLKTIKEKDKNIQRVEVVRVTRRDSSDLSSMLGLMTGMLAVVMTTFVYFKDKEEFLTTGLFEKYVPMIAILTLVPILAFLMKEVLSKMTSLSSEMVTKKKEPITDSNSDLMSSEETKQPNKANSADEESRAAD